MRRKTANKEDIAYELRNKLYDKYGLELTPKVALLLVNEIISILKVMILSRYYDKINLEGLGFFKYLEQPSRLLSGNLPSSKKPMMRLPKRFKITFTPTKEVGDKIRNFQE